MLRPLPTGRVAWTDPRLRQAWWVLALASAVALLVFPRTVTITDEAHYAGQALGLLHGHLVPTSAEAIPFLPGKAEQWVRYPYGWPLLLAPLRLLGFRALFLATLALHLLGGAAAARMLVRRGLPAWLAAAYVFHPVAWVFSRTLMSDVPTAALLLLSMDLWEEGKPGRGALALGYSIFARMGGVLAAAGVGLAVLAGRPRPRVRDVVLLAMGPIVAAAVVVALNRWALGSPLGAWYGGEGVEALTGTRIPLHLLLYAGGLLLLPPFPLAWLLLRPGECDRWALAALPTLAFFVFYAYHDAAANAVETFLGGQRLILSAHVVLLVATMRAWAAVPLLRFRRAVLGAAAACAACASIAWRWRQEERFIPAVEAVRACRPRTLAYNGFALRVAAPVEAREYRVIRRLRPPPLADVVVFAPHEVSRSVLGVGRRDLPFALRAAAGRCRQAGAFLVFDFAGRCPEGLPPCALPPPAPPLRR